MPNRLPQPSKAFGLIAWLEKTRVQLPLKAVECRFTACGELLNVEIDQIFRQNHLRALDCLYSFPLPGTAAVYKCEMHVNGRLIEARVEEQEEARRMVKEKKAAGFRTGLVEMERDNLFTLSLGNLQPNDLVVVRLVYFQTLTRLKDWTSFNIPFCPGVRYIPGAPLLRSNSGRGVVDDTDEVPDASRISPPRIDALHRDAACLYIDGVVQNPGGAVVDVSSPTHPLVVRDLPGAFQISIAEGAAVPDRDLVVRWTDQDHEKLAPVGWRAQTAEAAHALVRLKAPKHAEVNEAYEQDVYFLIDRSGSMAGMKWKKAAQAFLAFLRVLGKQDRAWVTFFETNFQDFSEKPLSAAALLQDPAILKIAKLGVAGGTELLPALNHVLEKVESFSGKRPASLLLITDGQVGNEQAILDRLAKHPTLRVHTFGIDTAVNDAFLNRAAAQQHGQSCLLTPDDDIAGAVSRLGDRLRRPVLASIRVLGDWEIPGGSIPDLCAEEVLNLPLKGKKENGQVVLEGKSANGQTQQFTIDLLEMKTPALAKLWVKQRIEHLLATDDAPAAISLAKQHNLVCRGAAFVAWDEHEKVPVAAAEEAIYQPSMLAKSLAVRGSAGPAAFYEGAELTDLKPNSSLYGDVRKRRTSGLSMLFGSKPESEKPILDQTLGLTKPKVLSQTLIRSLNQEPGKQTSVPGWAEKLEWLGNWCEIIFETSWLSSQAGYALVETVCRWALENPAPWEKSQHGLMLLGFLVEEEENPRASLRGWITSTLTGNALTEALTRWEALEELPNKRK